MKMHVEMLLWRALLRNLNTDKLTTDCRKFNIQNLWPALWMTPVLKYLVCCAPSALIHIRRKAVCTPEQRMWPGVKGCSWCVSSPPQMNSPKSGLASSFPNHLLERCWLWSIWDYVCLCVFTGRFFWLGQNWDALKPYGCGRFGHSFIMILLVVH